MQQKCFYSRRLPHNHHKNSKNVPNQGQPVAQAIGEQPKSILTANLEALLTNSTLPYATTTGQTSDFNVLVGASQTDPRSHGSQVKQ